MGLSNYVPSSRVSQAGVCTSTTRPASPYEGQMIYETDTNRVLVYDNTAWVMIADTDTPPGLERVTTGSFSASSAINVSDCFTSTFANYKIIFDIDSANNQATRTIKMRWRTSSGDDSSANYDYGSQGTQIGGTTFDQVNAAYSATEIIIVSYYGYLAQAAGFVFDVISPQVSTKKTKYSGTFYGGTAAADVSGFATGYTGSNTTHTGFSVYPSAGSITGTYAVYGYRN